VYGCQQDPAAPATFLLAGFDSCGLLPLLREPYEDLGWGPTKHRHWRIRRCLQAVVGPLQQMLGVQHWIDQEILRNKYPAHCNHSFFIYVFQFDFECTTSTRKNGNFHVFAANPKQKLVFTGQQTINGNRLLLLHQMCPPMHIQSAWYV
jgi:hypothetical protein